MISILIRCDASLVIGSGHVMRCLTLARELRRLGASVTFVCRRQPGDLIGLLQNEFVVVPLPKQTLPVSDGLVGRELYASWLGCSQDTDAAQCLKELAEAGINNVSWLVVDHYGLDSSWEAQVIAGLADDYGLPKLLVIDDLADRRHLCDLILDQNMYDNLNMRYHDRVPSNCSLFLGPQYALLRPEFNRIRATSLAKRAFPTLNRLFVFLGGSDVENETGKVIEGLFLSKRKWDHVDVVVGQAFPSAENLKRILVDFPSYRLHIQTTKMAELMSQADLAITAGGTITWEKCVLGLPSLTVIEGDNQHGIVTKMHEIGALRNLGSASELAPKDYVNNLDQIQLEDLSTMSESARSICDGSGAFKIALAIKSAT